jgi:hypothetical protein
MFHAPRFGSGTQPAAPDETALPGKAPRPLSVKDTVRRVAMLKEASQVLDHLPEPGEAVHFLLTGRYDLMVLPAVIREQRPVPCEVLRIGTLSLKKRNVYELCRLLDAGKVARLSLLVSAFSRDHNADVCQAVLNELAARGPHHRFAAARSHCKVVTMQFSDGEKLVWEGSANLRSNSSAEQAVLINHPGLHDFHATWLKTGVPVAKSTKAEVTQRVEEVLSLRLAGAGLAEIVRRASEKGWGVGERQLQNYIH